MNTDQKNEESAPNIKRNNIQWKLVALISSFLFISTLIGAYLIIGHNNKVLYSWKTLYEDLHSEHNKKIQAYESTINQLNNDLKKEQAITTQLLCSRRYNLSDEHFEYGGNATINRELNKFVEHLLTPLEHVTGSTWNTLWSEVDLGMHRITITDNTRLYFITSFKNNDLGFDNSVYWIDGSCFLDFSDKKYQ
jgi:hypothetical protein